MTVFVSGATGFIGSAILRALAAANRPAFAGVRAPVIPKDPELAPPPIPRHAGAGRHPRLSSQNAPPHQESKIASAGIRTPGSLPAGQTEFVTGDLSSPGLQIPPVTAVVHAAGLGHRRGVKLSTWRDANVTAALNLAQAAKQAGATKFILISTAHVHGRVHDGVVSDDTATNPMDDYAASKLEAEAQVAAIFGPGLCIIRPVAVIGPHCPGNLPLLIKLLRAGIPLPFGSIVNQRSFIDAADLASLVLAALNAPAPPGMILAAHPEPVSTPALIRALAAGLGRPARLLPCPAGFLATAAKAAGRAAMWQSLAGSFVAAPKAALSLGWSPHQSISESLMETSRYYNTTTPGA